MRFRTLLATVLGAVVLGLATPAQADTGRDEILVLEQLARERAEDPDAQFDLAMGYARTPVLEKAIEALERVQALDKAYADKVIARFEPIAQENPENVEAHWRLAFAYYAKGRETATPAHVARARQAFEDILKLDSRHVWAYNYLAYITYEGGDLPGALDLARRAVEVGPDNAVAHFLVGQALLKQGQPFAAAFSLAKAMQLRSAAGYGLPLPARPNAEQQSANPAP
ncbi:MAG: tetratricopeptide repeat protein [Candidatus Sericytochromatia bacterium]|nr:tetratricopeptide repeat protein [Candidatus Tanganyikabacteria bacterium]